MRSRLSLAALLLGLSLAAWLTATPPTTHAYGETPCEEACEAEHQLCVQECGEHSNPMECDSACREQLQDCTHQCHSR